MVIGWRIIERMGIYRAQVKRVVFFGLFQRWENLYQFNGAVSEYESADSALSDLKRRHPDLFADWCVVKGDEQ